MEDIVSKIASKQHPDHIWLLEHPPVYTAGTGTRQNDSDTTTRHLPYPLYQTGRGGKITYHGPGQRIIYSLINLKKHPQGPDLRLFIQTLELWMINTLKELGVHPFLKEGMIGVWVKNQDGNDAKIAAIGVRARQWVTFHGMSLNIDPNLSHFEPIVPCGISDFSVTSLKALGISKTAQEIDQILMRTCPFVNFH